MPDFRLMATALMVSTAVAAWTLLLGAWPWRRPHPLRLKLGWVLGLGAGIYAGCGVLGQWPRWPAPEDRDRFLVILLPLTLAVEMTAAVVGRPRWLPWLLRLSLAGAAAPILLYNSVYLTDLSGPHSAEWSAEQSALILLGLAATLAAACGLLELLQSRTSERSASTALVLSSLTAAVTVMLSGYYEGGLLGLPLAGAVAGATLASFAVPAQANTSRSVGVGVVGLFSVLLIGRFFGSLPTGSALCLLLAPLLAWVGEAPGVRRLWPVVRASVRVLVVAAPLVLVAFHAKTRFTEASTTPSSPYEPTLEDYKSFRK